MTKKKEKEEDIIEQKDIEKDLSSEIPQEEEGEAGIPQEEEKAENKELEYLDGWKRCQADFENYKKRQAEAQKDLIEYSTETVIYQILPVLDNFHASTDHIPEDQKNNPWVTGIMHIQKQLEDVLKDNGVEEIKVEVGDEFSPHIHEAIINDQETKTKEGKNKILKVVQKGYKIGEKVIRAARVVVG